MSPGVTTRSQRLGVVAVAAAVVVACSSSSSGGGAAVDAGPRPDVGTSSSASAHTGSESGPKRSGSSTGTSASTGAFDGGTPHDGGRRKDGASHTDSGGSPSACTSADAVFTTSEAEGQWSNGGYFIRNDAWNSDAGPQTLYACSYHDWSVVAKEASTTDVKTYPDVQMDFQETGAATGSGVPISSFSSITSAFAETSPHVGIYEDAYDIFVNGASLVGPGTTEIMVWVDNYGQTPAGSKVSTAVSVGGRDYDVYYEADNGNGGHYIAFVADTNFSSGTVDLLAFFQYVIGQSWIPKTAPLNQICFGVEICETNDAEATFAFTDFSISTAL
jgi:hypothetical protein